MNWNRSVREGQPEKMKMYGRISGSVNGDTGFGEREAASGN
jgi:hypothetical protein